MHAICEGCGVSVKRNGLKNHIHKSKDPRCKAKEQRHIRSTTTFPSAGIPQPDVFESDLEDIPHDDERILVDPVGDFFGDYTECDDEALEPTENVIGEFEDDDDEEDLLDAANAAQEVGLEPPREHPPVYQLPKGEENDMSDSRRGPAMRLRGGAEESLSKKPFVVKFPVSTAGAVYSRDDPTTNQQYTQDLGNINNSFAPFASQLEWEMARWAKLRGPSSTAFTELMKIDGVSEKLGLSFKSTKELNKMIDESLPGRPRFQRHEVLIGDEVCEVFFRDVIACIRALLGDPDFAVYLVFVPEKHYADGAETIRMYHDMKTGKWWWSTQEMLEKDKPGATIVPIIISTDKTQLTLFRNKSAYPIYLTIGNIPKEIRSKPSNRAYVLLGYLPTTRLENVTNKTARRRLLANLYHACMARVLAPLKSAGKDGVYMTTGDALTRRFHPLLACVVTDYPEQVLTTCTYTGECPSCDEPRDELGEYNRADPPNLRDLSRVLEILDSFETDPAGFLQACKHAGVKPVVDPYWVDLPYAHIYRSITPDVLHQLYQGILKHLIRWVIAAYGATEIDARCRRLPPNHNIRLFMKGISTLSRVTGQEHDQMCRILLGLIIDAPLPNGLSSARLLSAVRAMLDFLYLAQYPVHTDKTLELLEDALEDFHKNKDIFVDLGIRDSFNIPKLHWAQHYTYAIKLYGTTDNVNTQYTERLHIDLAKQAYAATNHKDEFSQMTLWVERKEKILRHSQYVKWRCEGSPTLPQKEWSPPGLELDRTLHMAKHPTVRAVSLERLSSEYGAPFFRTALARYVALTNEPNLTAHQLERRLWSVRIPFTKVPVWHRIKFLRSDPMTGVNATADSIHVRPAKKDGRNHVVPGRFDTALINDGTGELTGLQGYRVGRVRIVFSLPEKSRGILFTNTEAPIPQHLAYVEWYSPLQDPERHHGLHKISQLKDRNGGRICSIIPIGNIRRSIHLFPKFGRVAHPEWTSSNVLDVCDTFFVNTFTDRHLYRIAY
ncbi:hypothetical protein FPV67DRAFT_1653931 [Lyophyllum atratum]|nr:hypothetical protein FPV67DRAFT_1653931 [Lyophyllum atratum]